MIQRMRRLRPRRRPRRGFTLIEMIIAIVVMSIGVMGLAGTASYVAIQMGAGNTQTIAASLTTKVADSLSARRCTQLVDGSQTRRGVTVSWTVADSGRTKWVTEQVQYKAGHRPARTLSYLTVVQCPD